MAKTSPSAAAPAPAPAEPADAAASATPDTPLPLPASGGCWVRNPDGSLSPDPAEHPPQPGPQE